MTRPTAAWIAGLAPSAVILAGCRSLEVDENVTAALLTAPVGAAAGLGGRRIGVRVGALAGLGYALTLLAPFGHVRVGLTHDMAVLALLVLVGATIGTVADGRWLRRTIAEPPRDPVGSELLHAVSHDLRNPLSTIRAASSDLLAGGYAEDADKRDELLSLVVNESERLDRIVGNLLSAGRLQAGRLEPDVGPEAVDDLIGQSVARLRQLHPQRFVVDMPDPAPVVMVDAVQFDQILANLVENAARVSPTGSTIAVRVVGDGPVTIVVEDEGPGFDPALGDPLAPHVSGGGSAGLGLAVCRAIVTAHGGTIAAGAAPRGGGAVRFTLPVADV